MEGLGILPDEIAKKSGGSRFQGLDLLKREQMSGSSASPYPYVSSPPRSNINEE